MGNLILIEDLRKKAQRKKKITVLENSIKEYEQMLSIKKDYLKRLSKFDTYAKIEAECSKIYVQIQDLEEQIRFMKNHVSNLSQGKA